MSDPGEEEAARIAAASLAAGDATGWFERLYAAGVGVPWDRGTPHPLLAGWAEGRTFAGGRALVVGSGLGEDAEFVSGLGFATTAFDIAETAIRATRERFPDSAVDYRVADLLDPPAEWAGAFDLVIESYTVQALPEALRARATAAVTSFVAPGGILLVIAAGREPGEHAQGPPWPLTRDEVEAFGGAALQLVALERIDGRWRAEFRRASGTAGTGSPGHSEPRRSPMADEHNAADTEREMREHEAEAREREPEERRDKGTGVGDASADSPAPPGNVQEGTTTGS